MESEALKHGGVKRPCPMLQQKHALHPQTPLQGSCTSSRVDGLLGRRLSSLQALVLLEVLLVRALHNIEGVEHVARKGVDYLDICDGRPRDRIA